MAEKKPTKNQINYWKSKKGKTYEELFGKPKALEMRKRITNSRLGFKNPNWH